MAPCTKSNLFGWPLQYLETQFNLSKSDASVLTGGTAIPGACIGIFLGGYILKRMQLRPKVTSGTIQHPKVTLSFCPP